MSCTSCRTADPSEEMNWVIDKYGKRILAVCCIVLIVLLQVVFVLPADADTKAGEQLEVRVKYE